MTTAARLPRWQAAGLLALAVFAAARLSLLFALPPGYATVVWPPAGIALAALWLWGLELWPGVLLGSFAANAATAWIRGAAGAAPMLLAAWIAAGSTVQAALAAVLARRATGGRDPLDGERDLFRFLMVAGPLACLTAATCGTAGLLLFKAIAPREAAYSWTTWWAGDSIGVAFAAPLILLWSGRGPTGGRRGKTAVTAVLCATLAAAVAIHAHVLRAEETASRATVDHRLADASAALRSGLAENVEVVRSAADFLESSPNVDRAAFDRFARAALKRHPSVLALEWRPRAAGRFPALDVEPLKGDERLLGRGVDADSPARAALELALRTGKPAASGGLRLTQETKNETGVVLMIPVKTPSSGGIAGVVEGDFRVPDMMDSLLRSPDSVVKGVRVLDVTDPASPRMLDASGGGPLVSEAAAVWTTDEIAGRLWRVELIPAARFSAPGHTVETWLVLGRVLVLMYLVSWVVLTLYGRAERIGILVEQKTSELREQERRLMRAQRMESVGRLAGGIAHEFNNILMGASGLAQLVVLALGPEHPNAPDLEGIIASVKRAGLLVSQLLTYSRRQETRKQPTDLDGLILRLSKMISVAVGRRVELATDVSPEPLWIMADAAQVEQVLLNLCFNARDAISGKGKVLISTRPAVLESGLDAALVPVKPGRYAALEVADDGAGIAPDVLTRLAEPFFTTKAFGEGSGLGLSVASGIVRAHDGGMDLRTEVGRGTAITVYWPATEAPPPDKTPVPTASAPRGSGLILIVDDEPLVRPTLERILAGYGYRAVSAAGGEEALLVIEKTPEVRGVVLDLMMPGMDGLETYDRIQKLRPGLKVLFLSGFAPRASADEMARRGLRFLAKPADPERLAAVLHEVLDSPPA